MRQLDGGQAAGGGPPDGPALDATTYSLLQQQLISARARLDRQLSQLTRLNRISNALLHATDERPVVETFAEAIVDVLDLPVGAAWVLPARATETRDGFAAFGPGTRTVAWGDAGPRLVAHVEGAGSGGAVWLRESAPDLLPGLDLVDVAAALCVGRDGTTTGVVVTANTPAVAGLTEPVTDDVLGTLAILAEKLAAHLDNTEDRLTIESQMQQLRESEERLRLALLGSQDGWWDWDLRRGLCFVSVRWLEMIGFAAGEPATYADFWHDRIHRDDRDAFDRVLAAALGGDLDVVELEVRLRHEDGSDLATLIRGTVTRDVDGTPAHFAGSVLDLTERKRQEQDIHRLAFYDPLTDLPNRRLLVDRIQQALLADARDGLSTAVLMIDLDRFKALNDSYGHAAGDELLRAVASRLRGTVRAHDTVARLGGDEFVVLLEGMIGPSDSAARNAAQVGLAILEELDEPYQLDFGVIHHSASIGVAISLGIEVSVATLLQRADVALYEAKAAGRNAVRVFEPDMQARVDRRTVLEARLREALADGDLHVVYQAQVDQVGAVAGFEALSRWPSRAGEWISPSEFIPVAEESGLIHVLGAFSLDETCRQIARWGDRLPSGVRVAVNVSAPEFVHPGYPSHLKDVLRRTGIAGERLRLEITEATVVTDIDFAADRMRALRGYGIEFSLDDFGTGFSSLTYLRRLPVSEVKIDRSYVARFLHDDHDAAIVRAVISLCESLGLRVVAEGVETQEQWLALLNEGCTCFQGYLFGRPSPATEDPLALISWRGSGGRVRLRPSSAADAAADRERLPRRRAAVQ